MIIHPMIAPCFIQSVTEHADYKQKLLQLITSLPRASVSSKDKPGFYETISHTDWYLPKTQKREYLDVFYPMIGSYLTEIGQHLHAKKWTVHNGWFQQYEAGDWMGWHLHGASSFTNVYYIELPNKKSTTEILDMNHNLITLNIKEGDLVTIPSMFLHRSSPIKGEERKTVIAFNSSYEDVNNKEVNEFISTNN